MLRIDCQELAYEIVGADEASSVFVGQAGTRTQAEQLSPGQISSFFPFSLPPSLFFLSFPSFQETLSFILKKLSVD